MGKRKPKSLCDTDRDTVKQLEKDRAYYETQLGKAIALPEQEMWQAAINAADEEILGLLAEMRDAGCFELPTPPPAPHPAIQEYPPHLPVPFQEGGRVQSIAVHPTDARHIIVANQFGGLWKTEDGTAHWFHLGGLPAVFAIDVAYAADGSAVVATLGRDTRADNGGGIWVSRDEGAHWWRPATAPPPPSLRVPARTSAYGISVAPDLPKTVYVGTDYGVAISTDAGGTWSHYMLESASPVAWDKQQNAVLSVLALPDGRAIALCRTGVYRTDDSGGAWENIRPGDFTFSTSGADRHSFKLVDVSPLDADKVFVLQDYTTLLLYEVATRRWTTIPLPGGGSRGPFVRVARSSGDAPAFDLWVGTGDALRKITCADIDAVRAITAGDWLTLWGGGKAGFHGDTGYLGLDAAHRPILLGDDGGVFAPTNADCTTWTPAVSEASGLNSYLITDLAGTNVGPPPPAMSTHTSLYFSTQDNGVWASPDGGVSWPNSDCAEGFYIRVRQDALSDTDVTVAYGKVGCGPSPCMFSDANLVNQRAIPDIDFSGTALTGMTQAVFIAPGQWTRYRVAPSGIQLYVSDDNGSHWRMKAEIALGGAGICSVAGPPDDPVVYGPFVGATPGTDGNERLGLVKVTNLFDPSVDTYDDRDVIYLPDGGSLGMRATEFDWQTVYGVDPADPDFIIAPDVHNQVMKISRNGGASWFTDANLTRAVTQAGKLLLYDEHPYRMQVTRIGFDPYVPHHILIGTRDAGVIETYDRGATWQTLVGSEAISYITSFFFERGGTILISSYGRGLWKTTPDAGAKGITKMARLFVTTNLALPGVPVLARDGVIHLTAMGLGTPEAGVTVLIDGAVVEQAAHVGGNGMLWRDITVPEDAPYGEHLAEVVYRVQGQEGRLRSRFIKAVIDEMEEERQPQ